jgi:hypothetical protein
LIVREIVVALIINSCQLVKIRGYILFGCGYAAPGLFAATKEIRDNSCRFVAEDTARITLAAPGVIGGSG